MNHSKTNTNTNISTRNVVTSAVMIMAMMMIVVGGCGCGSGSESDRPAFDDARDPSTSTPPSNGGGSGDGASGGLGAQAPGAPQNTAGDKPCPNVDILFVIDNSGSMSDKQARLANSFPGFANAIQARLPAAKSVNVGVVATSSYYSSQPQKCLIRTTSGPDSSNQQCLGSSATSASYVTGSDKALPQKFACVAKVGAGGDDDETPVRSFLGALDPTNNAAGACNAGFSRPDSLLILVIISDEDDVKDNDCDNGGFEQGTCGSGGTPIEWHDKIVALKGGHPENVVVLSLLSRKIGDCSNTIGVNLASFTKKFGTGGVVGDVCSASYDTFFSDALPVIDTACVSFVAPK